MQLQCVYHKVVLRKWKTLNSKSDLNGNFEGGSHTSVFKHTLLVILKQLKFEKYWTRRALWYFICQV